MEVAAKTYKSFEELEVYKVARDFRKKMYAVAKQLPEIEKYGLASQIRRAAVSVTNNIAEGHGRYHYLDNIRFLFQSRGSLAELMDDLNACLDEAYLPPAKVESLKAEGFSVFRLINGYIRYLRDQKAGASLQIHESSPPYGAEIPDELSV